MIKDYFFYVLKHLIKRRLRSALTLLGIFIGMAAVVALISLSQGLTDAVTEQFESVGANRIIIQPAGAIMGPFSSGISSVKLTDEDVKVIKKVKGVEFSTGITTSITQFSFKDETAQGYIMGISNDPQTISYAKRIGVFDVEKGRAFKPGSRYEAVIGSSVAKQFESRNITVRDSIIISGKRFDVVGILKSGGQGFASLGIYIPKETAKELFGIGNDAPFIPTKVADGFDPIEVAENIKHALRRYRNVKEGQEDFTVQTAKEVIDSFKTILGIVQALLVGIASISLIVGGIGIMNTMYTAVAERQREIGIMKAIGAQNKDILMIFVIESGFLGLTGGFIGVCLGIGLSKTVELIASMALDGFNLKAHFSMALVLGVLAFSFALGSISGFFPARKASSLQPVDALKK